MREWWQEQCPRSGSLATSAVLLRELWNFLRDSTPERRRQKYGDMEYDWEHRVNTTSGTVGWRERLLGVFHSPYQPTDAALFREMIASIPIIFREFTFVDLGSGKGRTLLMASEYAFRRIIGVEILPELHQAALSNIAVYKAKTQQCTDLQSVCADAREFILPNEPLVLYLFNPLPEAGLIQTMANLEHSLQQNPRPVFVLYHNPVLEERLRQCEWLERIHSRDQFTIYRNRDLNQHSN